MCAAPPAVELVGLSKSYEEGGRRQVVLAGVEARIERGEIAVLVGRSGSGKSTLLQLLAGIDRPDRGQVIVDGVDLVPLSEERRTAFRRERIGFVFQFFNLIPTLTVLENLLLPLELAGRRGRAERERARALLAEVGLEQRAGAWPDRLSGGEQQRVAIARALVHEPALLLADEPTGNLDLDTGIEVLALLDRMTRQAGKTLVMVTHSREVIGLADRLLTIADGRLLERSTAAAT